MKKLLTWVVILFILISGNVIALGQECDYEHNWAKNEINYMKDKGIIKGYSNGDFRPKNNMSKSEFYKVVNGIMGYTQKSDINFDDVSLSDWYYDEVRKGVGANYIIPEVSLNADGNITRGEVARIIGVVYGVEMDKNEASKFTDNQDIPEELKGIVGGLKKMGYISGYPDGTFRASAEITRAEVVKILSDVSGEIVNSAGTVNMNYNTNLVVNTMNVTLKDMFVGGNLYLTEGIGEGSVTLDNVTVNGKIFINGGGSNSITIKNSSLNNISIDRKNSQVSVILEDTTTGDIKALNQVKLLLTGNTSVKKAELNGEVEVSAGNNTSVDNLNVTGGYAFVNSNGTIKLIKSTNQIRVNNSTIKANVYYKLLAGKLDSVNSAATLNKITIKTKEEEKSVNKVKLATAIYEAERKIESNYTEDSWMRFIFALDIATDVYEDYYATQSEVNHALSNLKDKVSKLIEAEKDTQEPTTEKVDKSRLTDIIEAAKSKNKADYTFDTWEQFTDALLEALEIKYDPDATQEDVDNAMDNLLSAIDNLEKIEEVIEPEEPVDPIEPAELFIENIFPNENITLYEGETLEVSFNAPEGGSAYFRLLLPSINAGLNRIFDENSHCYEMEMYEIEPGFYSGHWTVAEGINVMGMEVEVNFTSCDGEEIRGFAIGSVNILLEDPEDPEVYKTELQALIAEALEKDMDDYTEESWIPFENALLSALAVNTDEFATQNEVDEALTWLIKCMDELILKENLVGEPEISVDVENCSIIILPLIKLRVNVTNVPDAARYDVVYLLSGGIKQKTDIYNLGEWMKESMFFNPKTITDKVDIRIYDGENNEIYIFKDVVLENPMMPK